MFRNLLNIIRITLKFHRILISTSTIYCRSYYILTNKEFVRNNKEIIIKNTVDCCVGVGVDSCVGPSDGSHIFVSSLEYFNCNCCRKISCRVCTF